MTAPDKQLIVVVEDTVDIGVHWPLIVSGIEKIVRSFCGSENPGQKPDTSTASGSTFELAFVTFKAHGSYSDCFKRSSSWTKDVDCFLQWLSSLTFSGGGLENAAIAEGLSEALRMFAIPQNGYQTQQTAKGKKHCILVAASEPYPLPTPVYRPQIVNQAEDGLYHAKTVAQWFGQCSVSLSVIYPEKMPWLRKLFLAGKPKAQVTDDPYEVIQPHFLVFIPDSFMEARGAVSRTDLVARDSSSSSIVVKPELSLDNVESQLKTLTDLMKEMKDDHNESIVALSKKIQKWLTDEIIQKRINLGFNILCGATMTFAVWGVCQKTKKSASRTLESASHTLESASHLMKNVSDKVDKVPQAAGEARFLSIVGFCIYMASTLALKVLQGRR